MFTEQLAAIHRDNEVTFHIIALIDPHSELIYKSISVEKNACGDIWQVWQSFACNGRLIKFKDSIYDCYLMKF